MSIWPFSRFGKQQQPATCDKGTLVNPGADPQVHDTAVSGAMDRLRILNEFVSLIESGKEAPPPTEVNEQ